MLYSPCLQCYHLFFFFNDTATTEIYTLSLHDALPICCRRPAPSCCLRCSRSDTSVAARRSEEHTSELQSHSDLVCRLLLEKKKMDTKDSADLLPLPPTGPSVRPYTELRHS